MLKGITYIVRPFIEPSNLGVQRGLHLVRGHPVVRRPGVALVRRADVGAVLDAGDVARMAAGQERIGPQLRVQPDERAGWRPSRRRGGRIPPASRCTNRPGPASEGGHLLDPGDK